MTPLGSQKELPSAWKCTWCGYENVRQWAGLDRCSTCGAMVMTRYIMDNELEVRFSQRNKSLPKLNCIGPEPGSGRGKLEFQT